MENLVRTVNNALLQTCQLLGLPYPVKEHTTLNEKFKIHDSLSITETEMPRARYVAIGNGGHTMRMNASGIPYPDQVQHRPRDMALFNHLPFVLRQPSDDLLPAERAKYRLRRLEEHNGVTYVAYYLKVLDLGDTVPQIEYRSVQDGNVYSTPFTATLGDLSPTPQDIPDVGAVTTTGDYVSVTAKVNFVMEAWDIEEFMNVTNIIYGETNMGLISEIALCSGVDRIVTGNFSGISASYTDAIAVQVMSFIYEFFVVKSSKSSLSVALDIGSVESMLNLQGITP